MTGALLMTTLLATALQESGLQEVWGSVVPAWQSWLVYSVLPGSVLFVIAMIVERLVPRRHSRSLWIHALWLAGIVRCLLPPGLDFGFAAALPPELATALDPSNSNVDRRSFGVVDALFVLQGIGFLVGLAGIAVQSTRTIRHFRRVSRPARPEVRSIVRRAAKRLRLRGVEVRESEEIALPITVGIFKPFIVWPAVDCEPRPLTERSVRAAVALHEVAHVRHRDGLRSFGLAVVRALLWWNPLVYRATARAMAECEIQADSAAALKTGTEKYRRSLLALSADRFGLNLPARWHLRFGASAVATVRQRLEQLQRLQPSWLTRVGPRALLITAVLFVGVPHPADARADRPGPPEVLDTPSTSKSTASTSSLEPFSVEVPSRTYRPEPSGGVPRSCLEVKYAARYYAATNKP